MEGLSAPPFAADVASTAITWSDALARAGRVCFAIALVAFAVVSVAAGDFVAGRAPAWPAGVPFQLMFVDFAAVLFVVAAIGVVRRWRSTWPLFAAAGWIFIWALLRQLPAAVADGQLGGAWTMLGKALALSGGALGVAASLHATEVDESMQGWPALDAIARGSLGAFFLLAGIQHFLFAPFVATLVPAWIPGALPWTYVAGSALIASGIGLAFPPTSRLAATLSGLMLLGWLFVLHLPRAIAIGDRNELTAAIEALAFAGIALSLVARGRAANV
jgi:uncharacterized membrane protein